MATTRVGWPVAVAAALLVTMSLPAGAQGRVGETDFWNHHADLGAMVNSRNVSQLQRGWMIETHEEVSHTPLVRDGRVYFADWGGYVYAVDQMTGRVLWRNKVETPNEQWPWYGFAGTGALGPNMLYEASVEGNAYGIDLNTGRVIWKTDIAEDPQAGNVSRLLYYDGLVYVGLQSVEEALVAMRPDLPVNFQGKVLALDAQTGRVVWERPLVTPPATGVAVWSSFTVDPETNTLFTTTGNNYTEPATELSDALIALDAKTGAIKWARQVTQQDIWTMANPKGPDYDFGAGPQLFNAVINGVERKLVGAGQKSGTYYAWDRVTGEPVWSVTLGYGNVGGGIHAEPSIGNGVIYMWSNNAYPYQNPMQHPMDIAAVDASNGNFIWTKPKAQPAQLLSSGFLANDVYFVGALDGQVRAYRATDGELLWTSPKFGAVASSIWVDNGFVMWGTGVPQRFGGATGPNGLVAFTVNPQGMQAAQAGGNQLTGQQEIQRRALSVRKDTVSAGEVEQDTTTVVIVQPAPQPAPEPVVVPQPEPEPVPVPAPVVEPEVEIPGGPGLGAGWYWGLQAGVAIPEGDFDQGWDMGWVVGLPFGWNPSAESWWGLRGDITYQNFPGEEIVDPLTGGQIEIEDVSVLSGMGDVVLNFNTSARSAIYLLGGLGLHITSDLQGDEGDLIDSEGSSTDLGWNAGAGIAWAIGDRLGLFLEARYVNVFTDPVDVQFWPVVLGITF